VKELFDNFKRNVGPDALNNVVLLFGVDYEAKFGKLRED